VTELLKILRSSHFGSGPRGRRFKSYRPDHFPKKISRYFCYDRDGSPCLWAQRLDRARSGRPEAR
jgi:hypothetical protein